MNVTQPAWPQIVAGRKTELPKAWSKWPCVSTTTVIGSRVDLADVLDDLAAWPVRRARVDDERLAVAEDQPDVLVVERVATDEEPIADLDPAVVDTHGGHATHRTTALRCADAIDRQPRHRRGRHGPARPALAGGRPGRGVGLACSSVHGLGEHSGRYEHVGDQMAAAGLDAWAYDHRGKGGSGGRRGDVERWSQFHDDLAERLGAVRARAGGRPVAIYGHSMGGLVVAGYLLATTADRPSPTSWSWVARPRLDPRPLEEVARALLGRIVPTLSIPNGIDGDAVARPVGRRDRRSATR